MTPEQKQAYKWAKNQNYTSVAAQYAKVLAGLVDELQVEIDRLQVKNKSLSESAYEKGLL